jgi:hypothetical protein
MALKDASTSLFYIRRYAKMDEIDGGGGGDVRFAGDAQLTVDVDIGGVGELTFQLTIQLSGGEGSRREDEGRTHDGEGGSILRGVFGAVYGDEKIK